MLNTRRATARLAALAGGAAALGLAVASAGEVTVIQEGGGRITVQQDGVTVYDRTLAGETHVYAEPDAPPPATTPRPQGPRPQGRTRSRKTIPSPIPFSPTDRISPPTPAPLPSTLAAYPVIAWSMAGFLWALAMLAIKRGEGRPADETLRRAGVFLRARREKADPVFRYHRATKQNGAGSARTLAVYVDDMRAPFRGRILCHMVADTLEELHAMAAEIGMPRRAYQGPPKTRHPHYDIPLEMRAQAVRLGAVEISIRQAPAIARRCLAAAKA